LLANQINIFIANIHSLLNVSICLNFLFIYKFFFEETTVRQQIIIYRQIWTNCWKI